VRANFNSYVQSARHMDKINDGNKALLRASLILWSTIVTLWTLIRMWSNRSWTHDKLVSR